MTLSDIPEERKAQLTAIEIELATARDYIRDDLKAKFGYEENKFFDLDLMEYRINNSHLDIAEDLDLEERYGLTTDDVAKMSVSRAFRGHHDEDFMPEYQFEGLFSEEMNDYIEVIRERKGSLIGGLATVETHGDQMRNGGLATVETHGDQIRNGGRIGGRASRGRGFWQTHPELLEDIVKFRNEGLTWKDTTDEFNRRHGTDYKFRSLLMSYQRNKDLLPEEEE
jgi:hypothetical protein